MGWSRSLTQLSPLPWIKNCLKSFHGILILLGLFIGLCYLPTWMMGLIDRGPQSTDGFTLATCFVGLSFYCLWQQRKQLARLQANEEDHLLGYILIICGIVLFPVCRFAIWPQAMLWMLILSGIATASWGVQFFRQHTLLVFSVLVTVYPQPGTTARLLWQTVTPYRFLERVMANLGASSLQIFGWKSAAVGTYITFPEGAVDVDWGCNGFDMALTLAIAGLVMGFFLKQPWQQIIGFIAIGIITALIFNIPRLMLLAIASVYWGQESFDFWHGPWGGQIFSGVLLTVYYYSVMWQVNRHGPTS